ncbi:MAG: glycosyltransferase family 4 protein [Acidobacteria bacterium]|nr:glycosyltransferase family 4 protein [Acidobacteriota bacterium]
MVSTGLGRVLRGFESFTESLFQNLTAHRPDMDVTLFQGGGKSGERRVVIPNLYRNLTIKRIGKYKAGLLEQRSFAMALYPSLRRGKFDIVHYNELCMGSALFHLRRAFGGSFKLLYCNGAPSPPIHYHHRCDFAQMLTAPMHEEAQSYGISPARLFFVPYGVDSHRFSPAVFSHRVETRQQLGIPKEAMVVLTVAALSRSHKRIDHVMKELSAMPEAPWFLAAGQRTEETDSLEAEANVLLPSRWKFVSWPHAQVHRLFGAADVFVLGSLTEGLPISSIEAMLSGLPLVLHDAPLFRWAAAGASVRHVNMAEPGELRQAVQQALKGHEPKLENPLKRFSWDSIIPDYVRMYEQALQTDSIAA